MRKELRDQSGMTLVEAMIAKLIMRVGLLGIAQVLAFRVIASKTYGRDATRTTAAAHDKMEELASLAFTDSTTNVTVDAPFSDDGVGLTAGGSIAPSDPVDGYADYLDHAGARTAAGEAAYTRQWQIINDSATLKRIIVTVTSNRSFEYGVAPSTTVVTLKTP